MAKNNIDPKKRILDAAAELFAKKGFAAVGVRELAAKADVNISMISYYYGGKVGVLKAIINWYFDCMKVIISEADNQTQDFEERTYFLISKVVNLIRENTNLCMVAFNETLYYDMPEVTEYKMKLLEDYFRTVKAAFHRPDKEYKPKMFKPMIIGPALMSLIFSNFLLGDTLKKMFHSDFTDEFYEFYPKIIGKLFMYGIKSIKPEDLFPDDNTENENDRTKVISEDNYSLNN